MTTPNGQHPQEPSNADERPISTVLALDGWGPLVPEPALNGAADVEAEPTVELVTEVEEPIRLRRQRKLNWNPMFSIDSILRGRSALIAPAAAIGLTLGIAGGAAWRWRQSTLIAVAPEPPAPDRLAVFRRALALRIDPTLAEPCPQQSWLEQLLSRRQ